MKSLGRKLSLIFSAGCVGGILNSIVVWSAGKEGWTAMLGVNIAPAFTLPWLYRRMVWGGIWAGLFLLPLFKSRLYLRGLILSLGPSAFQLLYVFPFMENRGMYGLDLGLLTPVLVLVFNAVWGIGTALWLRWNGGG